ncbi:MAG: aldo/keto reductase [Hyphomonadaceae bacterium]|nr:aldo/keto reductase [Hyphomonadaceae bacterium]
MQRSSEVGLVRLGFGCAGLHGSVSRSEAAALLETALDHGVAHFDTARSYGWGDAEGMLGEIAARRRDEMIIVTKAGLEPPHPVERAANAVLRRLPGLPRFPEGRFHQFAPERIARSVETSLRRLRTEWVDALLMHEVRLQDVTDDLKRTLEDLKRAGKVAKVGIATSVEESAAIVAAHPDLCELVQVPIGPVGAPSPARLAPDIFVVHSVLGARLANFMSHLAADGASAADFAAATSCDPKDKGAVAQLMLAAAMREGVALFASSSRAHIATNAKLLASAADSDALHGYDDFALRLAAA